MNRLRSLDPVWLDRILAIGFVIAGEIELFVNYPDGDGSPVPNAIVMGVGYSMLWWRRRLPIVAGPVMLACWIFANVALTDIEPLQLPLLATLFASYAMGAYTTGRAATAAPFLVFAGMAGVVSSMEDSVFTDFVFPTAFAMLAWVAGRGLSTRKRLTEALHEASVQAREAHEHELARAAAEERRRIAREMHDVVAHSVSVMVVQAGGARRILDRDPDRAVEAAARIEEVGRAALAEMRRLLGVLHHGEDEARAPQPTLRELDALVERSRAAGLPVALTVEGEPVSLPAGKDLAAYRVVQEALTNAIKHAGAAPTEVTVRWAPAELELAIVDRGAVRARNGTPGGHGLVGMEERVRLYDGELRAGPRHDGGFEVVARLPL